MYANNAWEWILKDNLPSEGLGKKVTEYRKISIKIEPEREKKPLGIEKRNPRIWLEELLEKKWI